MKAIRGKEFECKKNKETDVETSFISIILMFDNWFNLKCAKEVHMKLFPVCQGQKRNTVDDLGMYVHTK